MNRRKEYSQKNFDRQAPDYDISSYGAHARKLYPLLLRQLGEIPHDSVLDVGCGTGAMLERIAERWPGGDFAGVDLSPAMVLAAQEKLGSRAHIQPGDAEALPFPDRRFQSVLCCDSFHHYPDPQAALKEIHRVLEPGGVFLLADTTAPAVIRGMVNLLLPFGHSGDVRLYAPQEISELLSLYFHGAECRRAGSTSLLAWGIK